MGLTAVARHEVVKIEPVDPCRSREAFDRLDDLQWYVLQVTPTQEFAVVNDLDRRRVFAFTPTRTIYRRANRATKEGRLKVYPSAPGYVIIGLKPEQLRWAAVFTCPGVQGVIMNEDKPVQLRRRRHGLGHPVTAILKHLVEVHPEAAKFMKAGLEYAPGQRVKFDGGPLEGIEGIVQALRAEDATACVLLEMFGSAREVQAAMGNLVKVEE